MYKKIPVTILWILYEYTGTHYIWRKIRPLEDPVTGFRIPAPITIWVIGIYFALYGIASQRYENRLGALENEVSLIVAQIGSPSGKKALERIPDVQKKPCPSEPELWPPYSGIISLFGKQVPNKEIVKKLNKVICSCKNDLNRVNLNNVNFEFADLWEANLEGAIISQSNLVGARLAKANLQGANLVWTDLQVAYLAMADLRGACIGGANLAHAYLWCATLQGSHLEGANLEHANLWRANFQGADLSNAKIDEHTDFQYANLEEATWINGIVCEKGSIGKCIQDGKEVYVYKNPRENSAKSPLEMNHSDN